MGWCLAFFQRNPKAKSECIGIYEVVDNQVYVQTKTQRRLYSATEVTNDGHVILSNGEAFLKELQRSDKSPQITYLYTEDEDLVAEYKQLLTSAIIKT